MPVIRRSSHLQQFQTAVSNKDVKKTKKLIEKFDVLSPFSWPLHPNENIFPIHYICCEGNRNVFVMFVTRHQDSIHTKTASGLTALHFAVQYSNYEIIEELLNRGVEVDAGEFNGGFTALHFAVEKRNMGAAKRLLEGMADMNVRDHSERTPKELAEKNNCNQILKFISTFENKTRFEQDMQRIAFEQTRQANEQANLEKRCDALEVSMYNLKSDMERELRDATERLETNFSEKMDTLVKANRRCGPPVPPRRDVKAFHPNTGQNRAKPEPVSPRSFSIVASPRAAQTFQEKVNWWNSYPTSSSFATEDSYNAQSRYSSSNQVNLTIHMSDSRQALYDSQHFGNNLDLSKPGSVWDVTSEYWSQESFQGDHYLGPPERKQIEKNFEILTQDIVYDRISAMLISRGVLKPHDREDLESIKVNYRQMTYLLNNVILKGDKQTCRLFMEILEENGYGHMVNKIRTTEPNSSSTQFETQSRKGFFNRFKTKSTPNLCWHDTCQLVKADAMAQMDGL